MEHQWGRERQAETDCSTTKQCNVTGEKRKRFEEMFVSFVPVWS